MISGGKRLGLFTSVWETNLTTGTSTLRTFCTFQKYSGYVLTMYSCTYLIGFRYIWIRYYLCTFFVCCWQLLSWYYLRTFICSRRTIIWFLVCSSMFIATKYVQLFCFRRTILLIVYYSKYIYLDTTYIHCSTIACTMYVAYTRWNIQMFFILEQPYKIKDFIWFLLELIWYKVLKLFAIPLLKKPYNSNFLNQATLFIPFK